MRLLIQLNDQKQAFILSHKLEIEKIPHQLETNETSYTIWIDHDDDLAKAQTVLQHLDLEEVSKDAVLESNQPIQTPLKSVRKLKPIRFTYLIVAICLFFFLIAQLHLLNKNPSEAKPIAEETTSTEQLNTLRLPLEFQIPLVKDLLFDYPKRFELIGRYEQEYSWKVDTVSKDAVLLKSQIVRTPYWQGLLSYIPYYLDEGVIPPKTNLFEKISEGQIWRLFSPAFLHLQLFHIFFNVAWLLILGRMIEARIGSMRFLFIVLISAAFSNTAQYFMSGFEFMGLSGVVCALASFIWIRLKKAPWEGYPMPPSTLNFIFGFIFIVAAVDAVLFFLNLLLHTQLFFPIANTAHLSGALIGYILGRLQAFARH